MSSSFIYDSDIIIHSYFFQLHYSISNTPKKCKLKVKLLLLYVHTSILASMSAPRSRRISTARRWPLLAAQWRAVFPPYQKHRETTRNTDERNTNSIQTTHTYIYKKYSFIHVHTHILYRVLKNNMYLLIHVCLCV